MWNVCLKPVEHGSFPGEVSWVSKGQLSRVEEGYAEGRTAEVPGGGGGRSVVPSEN